MLHDGVRIQGQDDGVWSRYAQLVSPQSDDGLVQQVDVWATESDMTWAEAQQALPSLGGPRARSPRTSGCGSPSVALPR